MLETYRDGGEFVTVECTVLVPVHVDGRCDRCGKELTGRQTRWCSYACSLEFRTNHDWNLARKAARRRDGERCVRCGARGGYYEGEFPDAVWVPQLEVNHLVPRVGRGYGWGCHNHLDVLETLCHEDHILVTRQQVEERALAELRLPRRPRRRS